MTFSMRNCNESGLAGVDGIPAHFKVDAVGDVESLPVDYYHGWPAHRGL